MKILLASPTLNGDVRVEYMHSVMDAVFWLAQQSVETQVLIESGSELYKLRSVLASVVLFDPSFQYLLFVDTDIGFKVSAVQKMLAAKKQIIGCACPYRTIPWDGKTSGTILEGIRTRGLYNVTPKSKNGTIPIDNGVCEVQSIGTGLMLIERTTLEAMAPKLKRYKPHFPFTQFYKHPHYVGFFDPMEENGLQLGEDVSFCKRWNGPLHCLVDETVSHTGPIPITGRYIDKLKTGAT